jgi:hypothetical protein
VPEGGVGLRHWTVVLEDLEDVAAVSGRAGRPASLSRSAGAVYVSHNEDRVKLSRKSAPEGQSVVERR